MSLTVAPCEPWGFDPLCCDLPDGTSEDLIESANAIASSLLWNRSGRRWGLCEVTVRPCRRSCLDGFTMGRLDGRLMPYTVGGRWYNATVCGCTGQCSCGELCEVDLEGPVWSIVSVTIDGVTIDPDTYRVDSPGVLVRQDPDGGCWPACQDLSAALGEVGTFGVTYLRGLDPASDPAAVAAVSELTCELAKACIPDCKTCRIPRNVVRRTMQGQTIELASGAGEAWLETLPMVAAWLGGVNPNKLQQAPRVLSPDVLPPRRTTWQHTS